MRITQPMHKIASDHSDRCQNCEPLFAEVILHVISENQKKVHVADEMPPASMQQQRKQDGQSSVTQWFGGNEAELFDNRIKVLKRTKAHDDTRGRNEPCNYRKVLERAAFLFDWKSAHRGNNFPHFLGRPFHLLLFGHLLDFVEGEDFCSFRRKLRWRWRRR